MCKHGKQRTHKSVCARFFTSHKSKFGCFSYLEDFRYLVKHNKWRLGTFLPSERKQELYLLCGGDCMMWITEICWVNGQNKHVVMAIVQG